MDNEHKMVEYIRRVTELESENKLLQHSSRLAQDAIAFTGHEWHNHLSLLNVACSMLMLEANITLSPAQKTTVERIQQSVTAMQHIASNFLDLARLEHSIFTVHPSLIDPIRDVIKPIEVRYADLLAAQGQTSEIRLSNPGLLIWADRPLLTNGYENLLSNAFKYGEPGGTIVLSVDEWGTEDEFSIWNSGQGIAQDDLDCIFERFEQGSNGVAREGTGFGLYVARGIIQAHGGRMWANSKPGVWATSPLPIGIKLREKVTKGSNSEKI